MNKANKCQGSHPLRGLLDEEGRFEQLVDACLEDLLEAYRDTYPTLDQKTKTTMKKQSWSFHSDVTIGHPLFPRLFTSAEYYLTRIARWTYENGRGQGRGSQRAVPVWNTYSVCVALRFGGGGD